MVCLDSKCLVFLFSGKTTKYAKIQTPVRCSRNCSLAVAAKFMDVRPIERSVLNAPQFHLRFCVLRKSQWLLGTNYWPILAPELD